MIDRETFGPGLEQLLAPISAADPCGPSVRYDPAFLALRQAREEDDPSLPMREWERPLRKADWRAVAQGSIELLGKSKDALLAGWLTDAWTRQHQIAGFNAGVEVLFGLAERYWDQLHPVIEDGDADARVSAFVWMNENLPLTLRLHVPLMFLPDHKPAVLTLVDWEQVVTPRPSRQRADDESVFTREQLLALADSRNLAWLSQLQGDLVLAQEKWDSLSRMLDERLALDAPSLGKVADTLRKLHRACVSLLDGRGANAQAAPEAEPVAVAMPEMLAATEPDRGMIMGTGFDTPGASALESAAHTGPITSRQEAYRMLEAAAAYLQRTEPHSPTPYLVKRAVTWGQMSLADLMQEIVREEGDLTRYFSLLGLNLPRD
jgi:type VI secretion system protein ImpA